MRPHTDYPALEKLSALVHQQRRLVAGQLRIEREVKQLNETIDALLADAGVEVVTCAIQLGTYEVRRARTRDGRRYASVTAAG